MDTVTAPSVDHIDVTFSNTMLTSHQTYIGSVLVSVNPYKDLEIYTKNHMERYRGVNFYEVSPHMWVVKVKSIYFHTVVFRQTADVLSHFQYSENKESVEAQERLSWPWITSHLLNVVSSF